MSSHRLALFSKAWERRSIALHDEKSVPLFQRLAPRCSRAAKIKRRRKRAETTVTTKSLSLRHPFSLSSIFRAVAGYRISNLLEWASRGSTSTAPGERSLRHPKRPN